MTLKIISEKLSHSDTENHQRKLSHSNIENHQQKLSHSNISFL